MANKMLIGKLYGISSNPSQNEVQNFPRSEIIQQKHVNQRQQYDRSNSASKKYTSIQRKETDQHYGAKGQKPRYPISSGQSALVGSVAHGASPHHNPYDVIEHREDNYNSAFDETGCVSADETINIQEVKSFKQRNAKQRTQPDRKSPDPYKGQPIQKSKQAPNKYLVTHGNINLQGGQKGNQERQSDKNERNGSGGSMKVPYDAYGKAQPNNRSKSNMSNKPHNTNYGRRQDHNNDASRDKSVGHHLNNDLKSDRFSQNSGGQNFKSSVISRTSKQSNEQIKQVPKKSKANAMSEYMQTKSRQDNKVASQSAKGKSYNTIPIDQQNMRGPNPNLIKSEQSKIVNSQERLISQLSHSLQKNRGGSGAARLVQTGSPTQGNAPESRIKSAADNEFRVKRNMASKAKDTAVEHKRVSLKQVDERQKRGSIETRGSVPASKKTTTAAGKQSAQRRQNHKIEAEMKQFDEKLSDEKSDTEVQRQPVPYYKGKNYDQLMKKERDKFIYRSQQSRSPNLNREKTASEQNAQKPLKNNQKQMNTARQGSPNLTKNIQQVTRQTEIPSQDSKQAKDKYRTDSQLRNYRQQTSRKQEGSGIYRPDLTDLTVETIQEQDSNIPTSPSPKQDHQSRSLISIKRDGSNKKQGPTVDSSKGPLNQSRLVDRSQTSINSRNKPLDERKSIPAKKSQVSPSRNDKRDNRVASKNKAEPTKTTPNRLKQSIRHSGGTETMLNIYNGNEKSTSQISGKGIKDSVEFSKSNIDNSREKYNKRQSPKRSPGRKNMVSGHTPNPKAHQSQIAPHAVQEVRLSIQTSQTNPHIDQQVIDLATSNILTDIQTPSRVNIAPPAIESEHSFKSFPGQSKASKFNPVPQENDYVGVIDRSDDIVNLDIDPERQRSQPINQKMDRDADKKPSNNAGHKARKSVDRQTVASQAHRKKKSIDRNNVQVDKQRVNKNQPSNHSNTLKQRKMTLTGNKQSSENLTNEENRKAQVKSPSGRQYQQLMKSKQTQRVKGSLGLDQKRGSHNIENNNQISTQSKTYRSNVYSQMKQSPKRTKNQGQQQLETSDDFSKSMIDKTRHNREQQSRTEKIDFRSTEIEILDNEIGHLRNKLDRLITHFDFKIFAKIGKVKDFRQHFGGQTDDEQDDISPQSFQNFCQLLLKIHGVNLQPKISEKFLKSLNISNEIKEMRDTIDKQLFLVNDIEKSHSQYLSELRHHKKGSLDEFIETSVKYAVKSAKSLQLNQELLEITGPKGDSNVEIAKQYANQLKDKDQKEPVKQLQKKSPLISQRSLNNDASNLSGRFRGGENSNRSSKSSFSQKPIMQKAPRLELKENKRSAIVVHSRRDAVTPSADQNSNVKSRNLLASTPQPKTFRSHQSNKNSDVEEMNNIGGKDTKCNAQDLSPQSKHARSSRLSSEHSERNQLQIQPGKSKDKQSQKSQKSKDKFSQRDIQSQKSPKSSFMSRQVVKKSFKDNADDFNTENQKQVVQINLPAPPSKYQELLDQQEKHAQQQRRLKKQAREIGLTKPRIDPTQEPNKFGTSPTAQRQSRFNKIYLDNNHLEMPVVSIKEEQRPQVSDRQLIANDEIQDKDKRQFTQSYNERLTDKNKGLQKMMTESNNMQNPYVNFHHKSIERQAASGFNRPGNEEYQRSNASKLSNRSQQSAGYKNTPPRQSRSHSNTMGTNSAKKRNKLQIQSRSPSEDGRQQSSESRHSKQQRLDAIAQNNDAAEYSDLVNQEIPGERPIEDFTKMDNTNQQFDYTLDSRLSKGGGSGFEGFIADVDQHQDHRDKAFNRGIQTAQIDKLTPDPHQKLYSNTDLSRQAQIVGYNIHQSNDNSSKKMRSVKTIEPEPESLDKNIITDPGDTTPDADYEQKEHYPSDNLKDAKLVGYGSRHVDPMNETAPTGYLNPISLEQMKGVQPPQKFQYATQQFGANQQNALLTPKNNNFSNQYIDQNVKDQGRNKGYENNVGEIKRQNVAERTQNQNKVGPKQEKRSVYTFQHQSSEAVDQFNNTNQELRDDKLENINFGTITSVHQTQGIESDEPNETKQSSQIFEKAASVLNGGHQPTEPGGSSVDDVEKRSSKRPSQRPTQKKSQRESYLEQKARENENKIPDFYRPDEHREIFNRDSNPKPKDRSREASKSKSSEKRAQTMQKKQEKQGQTKTVNLSLFDHVQGSRDDKKEGRSSVVHKVSTRHPTSQQSSAQGSVAQKHVAAQNLPLIFREQPHVEKLRLKPTNELIEIALEELQEQIQDDIDLEEGQYFFSLELCPKSDREAILHQARKLDSVIDEESDEYNMTNSQYSMQTPGPGGTYNYSKVLQQKIDPRSNNKSMQSVNSLRSMVSQDGYKSNSQLFVVQEDGFAQGHNISGKTTPYVPAPYLGKQPGRASDLVGRDTTTDDSNMYQTQSKLSKTSNKSQRILNQRKAAFHRINNSGPSSPGQFTNSSGDQN